jgi:hypothetical protein
MQAATIPELAGKWLVSSTLTALFSDTFPLLS